MKSIEFNHLTDEQIIHEIIHEHKTELFEIIYNRYFSRVKDKLYKNMDDFEQQMLQFFEKRRPCRRICQ